jgi:amino acid transporter
VRGDRQRLLSGDRLFRAQLLYRYSGRPIFGDGNTWQSIVGASVLLWVVHFLVLRGVQTAAGINLVATLAKLIPLGAFIILAAIAFRLETFRLDFSGWRWAYRSGSR